MALGIQTLPSTTALRSFEAAARHLSFTGAAAELGQTQGAISHQIRELETRLGVRLFEREARGIALAEAGQVYLPFVRESLERLRAGKAALQPKTADRVLTVSCSPNFAQKWLVPRLGDFLAGHPDIDLRISANPRHVTFDGDGIDLAVRHGDGDWPGLEVARLCEETVFPVCSPHLTPSVEKVRSVDDLANYVLIHDQDRAAWARWLEALGADPGGFDLNRGPVFSQTSFAIDGAVAGQGIALARSALAALDLAAGRLVRPITEELRADFAYWIVFPMDGAPRPNMERFREWLLRQPNSDSE